MDKKYRIEPSSAGTAGICFEKELNGQQLAAVTCEPGPALVIAGAGSGKTRTLTYRVAWLLAQGVAPYHILLLTFTNKAAKEMIERVTALVPGGEGVWGGTFHSVGNRILRRHAEAAGFAQGFTILDRDDQEQMINFEVGRSGVRAENKKFPKASVLADIFSYSANTCEPVEKVIPQKYRYLYQWIEVIAKLQSAYEARKRESNSLDFDDLLSKTLALLEMCPDILADYQGRFRHILVDEYQDTNLLQARMVDLLAAKHGSLMVVGDDAQSIYSWRGADSSNILEFPDRYPGTKVFKIETNYRSVPEVLDLANAAIAANIGQFQKRLSSARQSSENKPAVVSVETNGQQAAFVAQRVEELLADGVKHREIAILYRAHFHSMELQMEFTRRGIPFAMTSGLRFFEQAHIKDVAAYLKFAVNPADEISFKRMVRVMPGVGEKSADTLWEHAVKLLRGERDFSRLLGCAKVPGKAVEAWKQWVYTMEECVPSGVVASPQKMIGSVLLAGYDEYMQETFSNYDSRKEDLETLKEFAGGFEDAGEFLSQLALLGAVDTRGAAPGKEGDEEKVLFSTIHQAKGLEWRVVFVPWLTEGMFPGARAVESPAALEEERRLFYVAVTRCCDELYLVHPRVKMGGASYSPYEDFHQRPSRFLSEIPEKLFESWEAGHFSGTRGGGEDEDPF